LCRRTAETYSIAQTGKLSDIMTDFSVLRSRVTGTVTTPDDTNYTAGVDASTAPSNTGLVRQIGFALGPTLASLT
jgi:hypothetical protein